MIQRIQSIYLALAIFFTLSVVLTPVYDRAMEDPQQWIGYGFAISLFISMLLNVFSIGQYQNRKKQISWVKRAMIFQVIGIGFSVAVLFSLGGIGTYLWKTAIGCALIIFALLFQFLALRAIDKDEKLVRSIDRIR
ncbi:MAG: DUF4293 family protein [Balneolaceae bacterium]